MSRLVRVWLLPVVLLAASCGNDKSSSSEPNDAVQASLGNDDALLLRVEEKLPGFGGLFYGDDDAVMVYIKQDRLYPPPPPDDEAEPSQLESLAEVAIREVYGRAIFDLVCHQGMSSDNLVFRSLKILPGAYTVGELREWRDLAKGLLAKHDVQFVDLDESANRVAIGILSENTRALIARELGSLGVPVEAVNIKVVERVEPLGIDSVGGIPEGGRGLGGDGCTFGFGAVIGDPSSRSDALFSGFFTNSHCTSKYAAVDSASFLLGPGGAFLGVERVDPPYYRCINFPAVGCRRSDAAFVEYRSDEPGWSGEIGRIAQTEGVNSESLEFAADDPRFFKITEKSAYHVHGQVLDKVGRATGWTSGRVSGTDVWQLVGKKDNTIVMLTDQVAVSSDVRRLADRGDSGSPVFFRCGAERGPNVRLSGLLWGGTKNGKTFYFSPLTGIEKEFGELGVGYGTTPP